MTGWESTRLVRRLEPLSSSQADLTLPVPSQPGQAALPDYSTVSASGSQTTTVTNGPGKGLSIRELLLRSKASSSGSQATAAQAGSSCEDGAKAAAARLPCAEFREPAHWSAVGTAGQSVPKLPVEHFAPASSNAGSSLRSAATLPAWDRRVRHTAGSQSSTEPTPSAAAAAPPQAKQPDTNAALVAAARRVHREPIAAAVGRSAAGDLEDPFWDAMPAAKPAGKPGGHPSGGRGKAAALKPRRPRAAGHSSAAQGAGQQAAEAAERRASASGKGFRKQTCEEPLAAEEDACPQPQLISTAPHGPSEPLLLTGESNADGGEAVQLAVPAFINQYLREYQRDGVRFLFRQYARGLGGVLADDMGLGKTVQCIAFIAALLGKTGSAADLRTSASSSAARSARGPVLIVAPSSLLDNWQREFQTWGAGSFRVTAYHGAKRALALAAVARGEYEAMVTSYDTFFMSIDDVNHIPWHVALFDEAHRLRNPDTKTFKAAAKLRQKCRRFGLTGTPMQNDYGELFTLLDFMVPGKLGDRQQFADYYTNPMKLGQKSDACDEALGKARKRQEELQRLLQQYLLRRTKDSTIKDQLPKKKDHIVFCELSDVQFNAYRRVLGSPDFQALLKFNQPCDCGSGVASATCCRQLIEDGVLWRQFHLCQCDNERDSFTNPDGCKWHKPEGCQEGRMRCPFCLVLPCLTVLRKISNHLELMKADPEEERTNSAKFQRDLEVAALVMGEDVDLVHGLTRARNFLTISDAATCGKLTVLDRLLKRWSAESGTKVLIFSHSVRMLDIIQAMVDRAGYHSTRLTGSTPVADRQKEVDRFNSSQSLFLFLISTTAGGVGLNLTAANKVVIVDPSWNPAHDLQAQDRAFRIGQRRDVHVYRLVAAGTLEELVYARQVYKQQQTNVAVSGAQEERYWQGVQGNRKEQGELWGIANLLQRNAEELATRNIAAARAARDAEPDIQDFDAAQVCAADCGVQAGRNAATGARKPAKHENSHQPSATQAMLEDPGFEVEDEGLGQLARAFVADAAAATGDSSSGPAGEPDGDGAGNGETSYGTAAGSNEALATLDLLLEEAGAVSALQHDRLLSSGSKRQAGELVQAQGAAGCKKACTGGAECRHQLMAVESLAAWQGVAVADMAARLLAMTAAQRKRLCEGYQEQGTALLKDSTMSVG